MISMSTQTVPRHSLEEHQGSNNATCGPARYVRFGTFQLDLEKEELFKNGARVKLQSKVCEALLALLSKPGEIVTREELRRQLWPSDTHVNYDANVNTTVNKLRQVLGDSPDQPAFVDTIPRKGYCFVAKVEYLDRPVAPPERSSRTTPEEHAQGRASFFPTTILSKWFNILARHALGEEFVFHAPLHGVHFQIQNTFRRAHVRTSGQEAGQLVAGKERVLQRRLARHVRIVRMREDGADDLLGVAHFAQDFCALRRMPLVRRVFVIGPALVVEIVQ
ncbi:MAG: hypothetical protein DMG53_20710 [Acidobacteria bacterium]|nr:MAG: hypothetical protein DMG53_20710 [Acidobacteriota bacterium]